MSILAGLFTCVCLSSLAICCWGQGVGDWRYGRMTYYGTDGWSIHEGSCDYKEISRDEPLGWDVAAMADVHPDYPKSCGRCYEVACNPSNFRDNYGESIDRTGACRNSEESVVVRIVDTCPCMYPNNAYSNKRWCCGDMDHFDVSIWAFEKLVETKWGVAGMKYRQVPCNYQPNQPAQQLANPTGPEREVDVNHAGSRSWPDINPMVDSPMMLYDGGVKSGWALSASNAQMDAPGSMTGVEGGQPLCMNMQNKGGITLAGWAGAFADRIAVHVWVYMGTSDNPGLVVLANGAKGSCRPVELQSIKPTGFKPRCQYCTEYWWKYEVYFSAFAGYGVDTGINNPKFFSGCGGNDVKSLTSLEFRNYEDSTKHVCLDYIQLV